MRDLDAIWADVEPWLAERETRRKTAVKRFASAVALAVIGGLAVGGAVVLVGLEHPFPLIAGALFAFGAVSWGGYPLGKLRKEIKLGLNERLAGAFGLRYTAKPVSPARFDAFTSHGLVPRGDRRSFEDNFAGEAHGAEFELYEAHVEERRRSKRRTYYVTIFRGVLIRIRFPRTIEGVTLITRDKGVFNMFEGWAKKTFGSRNLDRIGLVDPSFEELFEVYGTDQVMARYLLTPSFMERLLKLEEALKGKNVRAVFDETLAEGAGEGELLIAAETGNQFEPGTLFKPLADRQRVARLHAEFSLVEDVVETVVAPARFEDGER